MLYEIIEIDGGHIKMKSIENVILIVSLSGLIIQPIAIAQGRGAGGGVAGTPKSGAATPNASTGGTGTGTGGTGSGSDGARNPNGSYPNPAQNGQSGSNTHTGG
jgi:hypothetical protein